MYALVEGFRHEWGVIDRAALAIESVHPEPDRLTIEPVAGRELELLTMLLPYYDGRPGQMGNFFGVPGLRLRPDGRDSDYWELGWLDEMERDRGTRLCIRRPRPGAACCPRPLGREPMASRGWRTFIGSLRRCGTPTLGRSAAWNATVTCAATTTIQPIRPSC